MSPLQRIPLVIAVIALIGAACAPAAQPAAPAAPAQPAAAPAPAAKPAPPPAEKPQRGGILKTWENIEAPHLDFVFINSVSLGHRVMGTIYQRAMRYKSDPGVDPNATILEPQLVERWEVRDGGKTILFHVRKAVKWHNVAPVNGRELTADDFVFSYNRLWKTQGSGQATWFRLVENIEATDKYTLKITMKEPSAAFMILMGHTWASIHAKEVVEKDGDLKKTQIGTGPFMMNKREPQVVTSVRRNPDYWESGKPYLDGVDIFFFPDASAALSSFRARQLDHFPTLGDKAQKDSILSSLPDVKVTNEFLQLLFCKFHFDTTKPPWNNEKLRQAVSLTLNRQAHIDTFAGGEGSVIGIMPLGWAPVALRPEELGEGGKYWKRDLKLAAQLVKEAGFPVPFEVPFLHNLLFDAWVSRFVNDLNEGPFKLQVKPITTQEYLPGPYIGKWPPGFGFTKGCGPATIEAGQFMGALFDPTQVITNNSLVNDPVLTKMVEEQEGILDSKARLQKLHEIQRYAATKMYYVPTAQGKSITFVQPSVMDFNETISFNRGDIYHQVWLKK